MSNVQLGMRLISNVCEIPAQTLNTGRLTREEWDRYGKRTSLLLSAPMYFDDTPGITVGEFRSKAMKLVREKGVKIIFIDYLQLMNYGGKRFNTRQEEIQEISKSLKGIAKNSVFPLWFWRSLTGNLQNAKVRINAHYLRICENREPSNRMPILSYSSTGRSTTACLLTRMDKVSSV